MSRVICFIDSMHPVTPAEREGWACFLALPKDSWRDARIMFRKVHRGTDPDRVLAEFVAAVGMEDGPLRLRLEAIVRALSEEARTGDPSSR